MNVSELKGKVLKKVERVSDDVLLFHTKCKRTYKMYHAQQCCEGVYIDDICGDLNDLIGTPILVAEAVDNIEPPELDRSEESYTWTFYKIDTVKGGVTIRWFGSSNGFYSETVDFCML